MLTFYTSKDLYVGHLAMSYDPLESKLLFNKGFTISLFIRKGCRMWGRSVDSDGWVTYGLGPLLAITISDV